MIGGGGTAQVYLASRKDDDEPLVVKLLRDDVLNSTAMERFIEEFAMAERIQSRHVARILGHGKHENNIYLVMEFFEGGDLAKRLGAKPMPPPEALQLFRELMFALGDIHEKGILHREGLAHRTRVQSLLVMQGIKVRTKNVADAPDTTLSLTLTGILSKEADPNGSVVIKNSRNEEKSY